MYERGPKPDDNYIEVNKDGIAIHENEKQFTVPIVGVSVEQDLFLVDAHTESEICPPGYYLPSHYFQLRKNKPSIVAMGSHNNNIFHLEERIKHTKFYPASGVIIPRKMRLPEDAMVDIDHSYTEYTHKIPKEVLKKIEKEKEEAKEARERDQMAYF